MGHRTEGKFTSVERKMKTNVNEFEILLADKTKIRVLKSIYEDKSYIDIRKWYLDKSGEWKPTAKGISIPVAHSKKFSIRLTKLVKSILGEANE